MINRLIAAISLFSSTLSLAEGLSFESIYVTQHTSYTVVDPRNALQSKLVFPSRFVAFRVGYANSMRNWRLGVLFENKFYAKRERGEDFDWYRDRLTVYSYSEDRLKHYRKITLFASRRLRQNLTIFSSVSYTTLEHAWYRTLQHDFLQASNTYIEDNTLTFSEERWCMQLGTRFEKSLTENLHIELTASMLLSYIRTSDHHAQRYFYAKQSFFAKGFSLALGINYELGRHIYAKVKYGYEVVSKNHTLMRYYDIFGVQYTKYDSSYENLSRHLTLSCVYRF